MSEAREFLDKIERDHLVIGLVALHDISAERARQIEQEGFSRHGDDEINDAGDCAGAAACYAMNAASLLNPHCGIPAFEHSCVPEAWPIDWSLAMFKPAKDEAGARRDLVKAAALILAEIERIDRAAAANLQNVEF